MSPLQIETADPPAGAACVMCGGAVYVMFPVGTRWICQGDAERLAWHWAEITAVAKLCGVSPHQLGTVTR